MWRIIEHDVLPSTNTLGKELLAKGEARHGDVIQTKHQTAGRGRLADRNWKDDGANSLLMSVVLERLPVSRVALMQYLVALVVAASLRRLLTDSGAEHSQVRLKWPNDILIGGAKVCGILSEGVWQAQYLKGMIVGIGVNVCQEHFDSSLANIATSLKLQGATATVNEVRNSILRTFASAITDFAQRSDQEIEQTIIERLRHELQWMRDLPALEVTVSESNILRNMSYDDIADNGALLLRHEDGRPEILHAGSIRWSQDATSGGRN